MSERKRIALEKIQEATRVINEQLIILASEPEGQTASELLSQMSIQSPIESIARMSEQHGDNPTMNIPVVSGGVVVCSRIREKQIEYKFGPLEQQAQDALLELIGDINSEFDHEFGLAVTEGIEFEEKPD